MNGINSLHKWQGHLAFGPVDVTIWNPADLARRDTCPLCATPADGRVVVYRRDSLGIKRCPACRLLFVDPVPAPEALQRCYGLGYFRAGMANQAFGSTRDYFAADATVAGCG